ncbi:MAG: DUF2807 domain-containing protein [Magnetococcales bacterium]|nr:DUF2807 domain-containing protein [Magnetococcales bacterium]
MVRSAGVTTLLWVLMAVACPDHGMAAGTLSSRSERFVATSLQLEQVAGDVEIVATSGSAITLQMSGPESALAAIQYSLQQNTLKIDGSKAHGAVTSVSGTGVTTVVSGHSNNVSVNIGGTTHRVTSGEVEQPVRIQLSVPYHTAIRVGRGVGSYRIGDMEAASIHFSLSSGAAHLGQLICPTTIEIAGSGDVEAKRVTGDLAVTVAGSGHVTIHQGQMGHLQVKLAGTGHVKVNGQAKEADIVLTGVGDIAVTHVARKPVVQRHGVGNITIGNWPL